jgi:hypothetical protein
VLGVVIGELVLSHFVFEVTMYSLDTDMSPRLFSMGIEQVVYHWDRCLAYFGIYTEK